MMDEESDLFCNLQGEVTDEQLHEFELLQKQAGNLICRDDDSDDDDDTDSDIMEMGSDAEYASSSRQDELSSEILGSTAKDEESASENEEEGGKWDQEITNKFLNGELSFSQFTSLAEQNEKNEAMQVPNETDRNHSEKDSTLAFDVEMKFESERKKHKRRRRKRRGRLPRDMENLMGEANLQYARGNKSEAIKMCMEVIRNYPRVPEPYQTLGMLYEDMGDAEKSLLFLLIAAYLSPNDPEEWVRLAEMSQDLGNIMQAILCYTKALKYDPDNLAHHKERLTLYEQLGEKKRMLDSYAQIVKILKPGQDCEAMSFANRFAKLYHEVGEIDQATATMQTAFEKHRVAITPEDINLYLELLMSKKRYSTAVQVLQTHCDVVFLNSNGEIMGLSDIEEILRVAAKCDIRSQSTEGVPIDLRIKLVVCLVYLKCHNLVQAILVPLFEENVEDVGDLHLDVAEAYMDMGHYQEALLFLENLVASKNYNLAAVWLRLGECCNSLGQMERAVEAYERVVELAPGHLGARMSLSGLLQQLGRTDEALRALTQDEFGDEQNVQLLYQRCLLLYSQQHFDEFLRISKLLLGFYCYRISDRDELSAILNNLSYRRRIDTMREVHKAMGIAGVYWPNAPFNEVSLDEVWDLCKKMYTVLFDLKQFEELQTWALSALASPLARDRDKEKEAEFYALLACYFNKNGRFAYTFVKQAVLGDMDNNRTWNLFSQIVSMGQDERHNKFCLRLMFKHQDHIALGLLNGHNAMVAGSYKHSLGEYVSIFKLMPNDPLVTLLVGLTFIHMACQKFTTKKHMLVVQAFAFLNRYWELRGDCQEAFYNFGRALHQLGLTYMATYFYKKALKAAPAVEGEGDNNMFDLRREAAFNLALIYQESGCDNLALQYIYKYCVV